MDIVLEVFDTLIFDRIYALLLPATTVNVASNKVKDAATTTFSSMCEAPTQYHAASQFLQLTPSRFASMSTLQRDDIWRQTISLYLITWFATILPSPPEIAITGALLMKIF